jgi:hypothetical protein
MVEPKEEQHPTKADPRLLAQPSGAMNVVAFYGRVAGWAGSVLLLAALFWASIAKAPLQHTPMPVRILGILALLCIAFWVYSNIHQLVIAIRTRGVQSALNSALFSVLVLAILVLLNYVSLRHEVFRGDLTKSKQYSLSTQTTKIIKGLDQKVTITAFVSDEQGNADTMRRLLHQYEVAGGNKLAVKLYDFKTDIDKAQEYGARYDGTMYVECGAEGAKRKEEIQGGTEEQITSAILAATTGQKTLICALTGHGEIGIEGGGPDKPAFGMLKSILQNQQYQVDPLNLVTLAKPEVPADCKLLIIAGAKYAPTAKEMTAIAQYVDQGGNLLLLLEPPPAPSFADLLKAHGVTPLAGQVKDPLSSAEGNPQILAALPQDHDVTRGLQYIVLPTTVAFDVEESTPPPSMPGAPPPPSDSKAKPLLKTSDAATVANLAGRRGPFSVAVAVDESPAPPPQMPGQPPQEQPSSERKSRLLIVGDSDFITDNFISQLGGLGRQNLAFAAMSINWLVKNEKLVTIPPKEPEERPYSVTDAQRRFTWALTAGIVPLLIIIAGAFIWWRRRV